MWDILIRLLYSGHQPKVRNFCRTNSTVFVSFRSGSTSSSRTFVRMPLILWTKLPADASAWAAGDFGMTLVIRRGPVFGSEATAVPISTSSRTNRVLFSHNPAFRPGVSERRCGNREIAQPANPIGSRGHLKCRSVLQPRRFHWWRLFNDCARIDGNNPTSCPHSFIAGFIAATASSSVAGEGHTASRPSQILRYSFFPATNVGSPRSSFPSSPTE